MPEWDLRSSITLDEPGQVARGKHMRWLLDQLEYLSQGVPVGMAYKTVSNSINSGSGGTTYQNDNHLSFEVDANEVIRVTLDIVIDAHATPDFKQRFLVPTGSQFEMISYQYGNSTSAINRTLIAPGPTCEVIGVPGAGTGVLLFFKLDATLFVGSTPGTVNWQWAQNTADANNTTVWKGSVLRFERIG